MARNELCVSIPSYFRCPISLEVMKSPVSLSTGITYDRSSIQTWLDGGHTTCPATMQTLSSPSFVPNLTLHRLIHLWSLSQPQSPLSSLINNLMNRDNDSTLSLQNILDHARKSEQNRRILARSDDLLASIGGLLRDFKNLELIFLILELILSEFDGITEKINKSVFNGDSNFLSKFVFVLRNGSIESKIAAARILHKIAIDTETKRLMIETPSLLSELYNLIVSSSDTSIEAGLSALISIARSRPVKSELIRLGTVRIAGKILCTPGRSPPVLQRSMEMLDILSTCTDGRAAICVDERCVVEILRRLMKVSEKATEHGVTVLWSVCYLFRDSKAKEVVVKNNGLAKCLLLLQSTRSPIVKQMCGDLVKILRVNTKSYLGGYDTRTTHIMPH